jgi:hypothetical protein
MKEKIIALFLTAIMAATYFELVLAANNLGTYPAPFCSGGVCSFYTVYGSKAKADDLVGGSDVTARLAGENYVETSTTGGTTAAVTGEGARTDTASNRILLGEALNNARTGITSTDLPTLLKSGEVTDDNGNTYAYTQDITLDNAASVTYSTSGGDLKDPVVIVTLPTTISTTNYIYSARVTFSKMLNISDTSVTDNTIKLFGSEYTIGSGSTTTAAPYKLVLFGGANTVTLKEGEEQKVTIGGTEYTVKVEGVSSATAGVISVNGNTVSVVQGGTYKRSGLDVYVSAVYYYSKEAQVSSMKLSLGSQKLTLEDGSEVLFGTSDYVENTLVALTGTAGQGLSKIEVYVSAQDSEKDDIQVAKSYEDPVWKTFKLEFSSTTPALDSTNNDEIVMSYSGDKAITLKFKDYYNNENTLEIAYNNVSALTSAPTIRLMDNNIYEYHIKEGENVKYKDYVIVNQGDESHILQLTNLPDGKVLSTDTVRFKDMLTGTLYEKTMTTGDCIGTYCNVSIQIGSQEYKLAVYNGSTKAEGYVQVTWNDVGANSSDTGATYGVAGNIVMFPGIKAKNGEYIFLSNNYTTLTCGQNVLLPQTGTAAGFFNVNCDLSNTGVYTFTKGKFSYNLRNSSTTAYLTMTKLNITGTANALGVAILEEKQADGSTQDVVYLPIDKTGTSTFKTAVGTPTFSDTTTGLASFVTLGSNSYVTKAYDVYGTLVTKDTTGDQGKITVSYPDDQIYTNIFLLTSGATVSTSTTGGGTIKKVVPISDSVAKLDTDISDPATVNKNLVLIGGSCANSLVQKLVDSGKLDAKFTCTGGVPGAGWETGKGYIFYVADAFATGYDAVVIAGTDAIDTRNACSVMQKFDNTEIAAKLAGQTKVAVTAVSGAGITTLA